MAPTIVYEGHNLTLRSGAGVATYARNLAVAARTLGYTTKVLVGVNKELQRKEPLLTEIALYDARSDKGPSSWPAMLEIAKSAVIGKPFGIRTMEFAPSPTILGPAEGEYAEFGTTVAATKLVDVARLHFNRYGSRASLNLASRPEIFHATHPVPLKVRHGANLYTVHDIVPLRLPYATLDDKKYFLNLVRLLCKKADHIVTVSEFSRQDIIRYIGIPESRITNTYQAVSIPTKLTSKGEDEVAVELRHAFNLEYKEYFLFFGAIEPKKNLARLIDAFAASGTKRPLVIAGPLGWQYDVEVEKIQDERFLNYRIEEGRIFATRHVRRLSYVPFAQLVSLIRGARAVLFPSLYEGFGLPVLEAMLLGAPVMTSNVSSLPEIAGEAAVLVDPTDLDKMAATIKTLDEDEDMRIELAARGLERAKMFSPEAYQARLAKLYGRFAGATSA
jgi:glycosyltransferase involved in cell wall biosynthesis